MRTPLGQQFGQRKTEALRATSDKYILEMSSRIIPVLSHSKIGGAKPSGQRTQRRQPTR